MPNTDNTRTRRQCYNDVIYTRVRIQHARTTKNESRQITGMPLHKATCRTVGVVSRCFSDIGFEAIVATPIYKHRSRSDDRCRHRVFQNEARGAPRTSMYAFDLFACDSNEANCLSGDRVRRTDLTASLRPDTCRPTERHPWRRRRVSVP